MSLPNFLSQCKPYFVLHYICLVCLFCHALGNKKLVLNVYEVLGLLDKRYVSIIYRFFILKKSKRPGRERSDGLKTNTLVYVCV